MHSTMTLQTQKVLCITEALLVCPEPCAHEFGKSSKYKSSPVLLPQCSALKCSDRIPVKHYAQHYIEDKWMHFSQCKISWETASAESLQRAGIHRRKQNSVHLVSYPPKQNLRICKFSDVFLTHYSACTQLTWVCNRLYNWWLHNVLQDGRHLVRLVTVYPTLGYVYGRQNKLITVTLCTCHKVERTQPSFAFWTVQLSFDPFTPV